MSVRLQFSKTAYRPDEQIHFQVIVEGEQTVVSREVAVSGSVVLPGANVVPVTGLASVVDEIAYGTFVADGYTVEQDQVDPSRYIATPQ
ncbi:hypothetical protein ACIBTV_27190 [Micromonospora sp. NPDC049366]|uniref:hypothetical protein n=1 Tax=Micromonospora sp. NPDC049366 TaxID=3364271 RepID=UPI0037BBDC57